MKKILKGAAVLAVLAAVSAAPAQAQAKIGAAGTGLFSLEEGGGSDFGGMVLVGFGGTTSPIGFRVDGTYISANGASNIMATGNVVYGFKTAETSMFHPYLLAGGGITRFEFLDESEIKPMAKAGAGFDYMIGTGGNLGLFGEATFNLSFLGDDFGGTSKALQANVGVKYALGGN
jgi:hypothetical protein